MDIGGLMNSYDLNGNKQSFASWISMLRTYETPFLNLVKTDKVNHALFSWQTDKLSVANKDNSAVEGSDAVAGKLAPTKVLQNVTQILSKVVKVSDTASKVASWGRGKETAYQMEKAGLELFKDLEWAFLNNVAMETGNNNKARLTAGVRGLAQSINVPCPSTGAVTHKVTDKEITEDDLFDLTYNLYLAGSKANILCFHPSMALFFSELMESETRARIFKNDPKLKLEVYTLVDPLGQRFILLPLRQMPHEVIYAFNKEDFTQKILRSPSRVLLDREGSYDKWLLEMEVGLRLSNPCAVGVLQHLHSERSLLKRARKLNCITNKTTGVPPSQESDIAVDFVATNGTWINATTTHNVSATAGGILYIMTTSDSIRPDKYRLKVFDVTDGENISVALNKSLESDGVTHRVKLPVSFVQNNKKFRIECYGYAGNKYVKHVLGTIKLVVAP